VKGGGKGDSEVTIIKKEEKENLYTILEAHQILLASADRRREKEKASKRVFLGKNKKTMFTASSEKGKVYPS